MDGWKDWMDRWMDDGQMDVLRMASVLISWHLGYAIWKYFEYNVCVSVFSGEE